MSQELDHLLENMQRYCLAKAARTVSPAEPAPQEWENAADEYCRRVARTLQIEPLMPEVAAAMVPRIACAGAVQFPLEASYARRETSGDIAGLIEDLLIETWHKNLKPRWLDGRIVLQRSS